MLIISSTMRKNSHIGDWQDLRYFLVVAEAGTLSGAAKQLGVDHGTVSRRVARLENQLGLKLIRRLPRSCPLTPEGEEIQRLGRAAAEATAAVEMRARGSSGALQGVVRVSAPPALGNNFIAPRLGLLREKHPLLQIDLRPDHAMASLDRGDADLAVRLSRPQDAGVIVRKLGMMTSSLYGAPALLNSHAKDWTFIAFGDELDHIPQQRWLKSVVQDRPISLKLNDLIGQMQAACGGVGVAVLPDFLACGEARLTRIPWETEPPSREIWLMTYPDLRRSEAIRTVMDFLIQIMRSEFR